MKIYSNPDKKGLDFVLPTALIFAIVLAFFLLKKTIITSNESLILAFSCFILVYLTYFMLQKFKKIEKKEYSDLFLIVVAAPLLFCFALSLNFLISSNIYHERLVLYGHIYYSKNYAYFEHPEAPQEWDKFYHLGNDINAYKYDSIEIKVNVGILGFPVLKKRTLY
jgi:predicted neutral ceramidase superfamily lipid hydrolase